MHIRQILAPLLALVLSACGTPPAIDMDTGTSAITAHRTLGVNAYLWQASMDTVSFMPLISVDPFGGVIISDWYAPPTSPSERLKVTVYVMDRALRADGLKVVVFRQERIGADWQYVQTNANTARKLEDAILTRARALRLASRTQAGS